MTELDIDNYRLTSDVYKTPAIATKRVRAVTSETWFIASVPGPWIAEAAKLPGHALHVALAILYVHGMHPGKEVVLMRFHLDRFATKRGPTKRGLEALQQAGLITFVKRGHKLYVTVLPFG